MCKSFDNRRHKGSYEQGFVLVLCQDLVIGFEAVPAEWNRTEKKVLECHRTKVTKETVEGHEKKIHILISVYNQPYAESCGEDYRNFLKPLSY